MPLPPDVTILGAGLIGLSLALELQQRGARVELRDVRRPAAQASRAAAGMLAAEDPHNPPALLPLARLSASLYPAFLQQLEEKSGVAVPFQTEVTWQGEAGGFQRLAERSLEPRQLAWALATAVRQRGIRFTEVRHGESPGAAEVVVRCMGAWTAGAPVQPRKGQMLRVQLPAGRLTEVYRSRDVYVVPRLHGSQAGTALIGATVEDTGFEAEVVPEDLRTLRRKAAALVKALPELADAQQTPLVEAWAGLRPATPDELPLLGFTAEGELPQRPREVLATGHYRNGVLLTPATARVVADLMEKRQPEVDLAPFSPLRFAVGDAESGSIAHT